MRGCLKRLIYIGLALGVALCLVWPCTMAGLAQTPFPSAPAPELKPLIKTQVKLGQKPIFPIQNQLGSFTAEERAAAISRRLEKIAKDPGFSPDAIVVSPRESVTEIYGDKTLLMVITEDDARKAAQTREILAQNYVQKIKTAIRLKRQLEGKQNLLIRGITTGVGTLILLVLIFVYRWLIPKISPSYFCGSGNTDSSPQNSILRAVV